MACRWCDGDIGGDGGDLHSRPPSRRRLAANVVDNGRRNRRSEFLISRRLNGHQRTPHDPNRMRRSGRRCTDFDRTSCNRSRWRTSNRCRHSTVLNSSRCRHRHRCNSICQSDSSRHCSILHRGKRCHRVVPGEHIHQWSYRTRPPDDRYRARYRSSGYR